LGRQRNILSRLAKWSDRTEESRLAEMRRGLAILREQMVWFLPIFEAALAEAEASAGQTDAGLRRLDDALAEVAHTEQRWYEAEIYCIRSEILLQRDLVNTAAAEQSLQAATAIAQSQKARSFELRAALSLTKLYRAANRNADAHAVLAPAVEGFPPTRQFPELAEAQTLLATLSDTDAVRSACARELASRVEDPSERFLAYYNLWVGHLTRGEPAPTRELAELLRREATARPDCRETLIAHRVSGGTCLQFGDFAGAHQHFQKNYRALRPGASCWFRQPVRPGFLRRRGDFGRPHIVGARERRRVLRVADRALADAPSAGHAPWSCTRICGVPWTFSAQPRSSCDLQPGVGRYRVSIRSPGLLGRHRDISAKLAKSRPAQMRRGLAIYREQERIWLLPEAVLAEAEASAG
jgi:hypothetical protein